MRKGDAEASLDKVRSLNSSHDESKNESDFRNMNGKEQGHSDRIDRKPEKVAKIENDARGMEKFNLGLIQKLAALWLGKKSTPIKTINLTMLIKSCLSMSDTFSDIHLAIHLFLHGHWQWALTIVLIDYLPMWQILLHTSTSKAWKDLDDSREKLLTVVILMFSPIAFPIFQLRWLVHLHKEKKNDCNKSNYLHQNCRVAELISGTVESPLQFMLMIIMYVYGVVPLPWSEDSIIKDSAGNELNVGALPGLISVLLSSISIVSNALDITESKSFLETLSYASFSLTTCIFRMSGYILAVITFREFSCIMFLLIAVISISVIIRFDKESTKGFSLVTTFIVGIFIPCAVSEEPQKSQYIEIDSDYRSYTSKTRRNLTAKIAMGAIPVIMLFNIVLFILLTYTDYKLSSDMAAVSSHSKMTIKTVILLVVIPTGVFSFIGAFSMKQEKNQVRTTVLLSIMALLSLSFISGSVYKVVSDMPNETTMTTKIAFNTLANTTTKSMETSQAPKECTRGWKSFDGYCYSIHVGGRPWINAQMFCNERNANLVSVHSEEESNFVFDLTDNTFTNTTNCMWTGGKKNYDTNTWEWVDGSDYDFTHWNSGQPQGGSRDNQQCITYFRGGDLWNDRPCHNWCKITICKK